MAPASLPGLGQGQEVLVTKMAGTVQLDITVVNMLTSSGRESIGPMKHRRENGRQSG